MPETCVHTPAVHAGQTLFVLVETSMQRADTPEQPTQEDEAKARKRARQKAWRLANPAYEKEYHATRVRKRKRCDIQGCQKRTLGKTDKCIEHGGGKRCVIKDCPRGALGKTDKCMEHGGGKRCVIKDCPRGAQGKTDKCRQHGGGKRCVIKDCPRGAEGKTDKCMQHGGGKRCVIKDCPRGAQGKTDKCIEHGGGLRCPNCTDWPDSRGGKKYYDGYCATCYKHLFPSDPKSKVHYNKTKELAVRKAIDDNFEGFVHDKTMETSDCQCPMRRRIDHRLVIGATLLGVETDEHAHRGYDRKDEANRYHDIMMVHRAPMVFIRFNPDGKGVTLKKKLEKLVGEIHTQIRRIKAGDNRELLEVEYLFYPQDLTAGLVGGHGGLR